jgi:hypothetical protein
MSWIEVWLDTAAAPNLDVCDAAARQVGAQGFNLYMGGRYSGGSGWTPGLAAGLAARGYGLLGTWVALRPGQGGYALGHADGLDAASAAGSYGPGRVAYLSYDVEPGTYDANPVGTAEAMRGFTDAVHSAGYKSVPYGVPRTVAAGSDNADGIWIANPNPGGDDPANQPLNPGFFAGHRSVQFTQAVLAGVTWDVSRSQFSLKGSGVTHATGDTLMFHPTIAGRVDDFVIGTDGQIYHLFGQIFTGDYPQIEGWGGQGVPGLLAFGWTPDGQHLLCRAVAPNGGIFYKQLNVSGATEFDWTQTASGTAMVPASGGHAGPPGPPGPAYDDSVVKAQIEKLQTEVRNAGRDLQQ